VNKHGDRLGDCCDTGKKPPKGSVGEGEADKKDNGTHHVGGKFVYEKSQTTRTRKNIFEKYAHQEYFVGGSKG